MELTEIKDAFGAYYINGGQTMKQILSLLSQGLVTPGICTPIKTDDTVFRLSELSTGSMVQAFQKGWTPKNEVAFLPNELRLYKLKTDLELCPDDIEATWLGFLAAEGLEKKAYPLIRFLIEAPNSGIISRINADMELNAYGKGVYALPTPGTAGTSATSMDGIIHQLQAGIDAETMNSVNLGTLTVANIFDKVEQFVDEISAVYQSQQMQICMSPKWLLKYKRDKRLAGFYNISSDSEIHDTIDFTNHKLIGLPCLNDTDTFFATPKSNLFHLTKKGNNKSNIKVEEYRRTVSLMCDWWEGLGFGLDGAVWTNLQKTPTPPVGG